jgi:exodeoxyribonuclease-5
MDTILSESPSLTNEEQKKLYNAVMEDLAHIPEKRLRIIELKKNPFFNALQIKFAYAVTCHKAQGGQWKAVFVEQGYITEETRNIEWLRWLYTAITRSSNRLYLVNFSEEFFVD